MWCFNIFSKLSKGSLHNTYLNHNCAVLSMSWRPKLADQCSQNSILTYSRDLQVKKKIKEKKGNEMKRMKIKCK